MHVIQQLGISVSEDTLQEMIKQVCASKEVPEVASAINSYIRIDGFRKGRSSKAPPAQIKIALDHSWNRIFPLTEMLLSVWSTQHQELYAKCLDYVERNYDGSLEITIEDNESTQSKNAKAIIQLAENFCAENPGVEDLEKTQLLIAYAVLDGMKQEKIQDEEEYQSEDSDAVDIDENIKQKGKNRKKHTKQKTVDDETSIDVWQDVLDEISSIPFNDPRWKTADQFIERIKEISFVKIQELEAEKQKKSVNEIWKEHQATITKWAQYFEITGVENWQSFNEDDPESDELNSTIEELSAHLVKFNDLLELPRAKTKAEQRERDDLRESEEASIIEKFQEIARHVSKSSEEEPGVIEQKNEDHHPDNEDKVDLPGDQGEQKVDEKKEEEGKQDGDDRDIPGTSSDSGEEGVSSSKEPTDQGEPSQEPQGEKRTGGEEETRLSTSKEVKGLEKTSDIPTDVDKDGGGEISAPNQLILTKLKDGEYDAAYWLAWGLEQQGQDSIVPSKLVAAIHGIFWSLGEWPGNSNKVVDSITEFVRPTVTPPYQGTTLVSDLSLITGIYYGLMDRNTSWLNWLSTGEDTTSSYWNLVEIINKYVPSKGIILDPDIVRFIVNSEQVDQDILDLSGQVKNWLSTAKNKSTKFYRANNVWNELIKSQKGELYRMLNMVARDQRNKLKDVEDELQTWQDKDWLDKHIIELDHDLTQQKGNAIVGNVRDTLKKWVTDICGIVEQWCSLVRKQKTEDGQNWQKEETGKLCAELNLQIDSILASPDFNETKPDNAKYVAYQVAVKVFTGLKKNITPDDSSLSNETGEERVSPDYSINSDNYSIGFLLRTFIMRFPELGLQDNAELGTTQVAKLIEILSEGSNRSIDDAIEKSISLHDYRFINTLLNQLQDSQSWEIKVKDAMRADVSNFVSKDLDKALVKIEQALLDGSIGEPDHTTYINKIESIRKEITAKAPNDLQSVSIALFSKDLVEIEEKLDDTRITQKRAVKQHWNILLPNLSTMVNNDRAMYAQIKEVVESSIQAGDLRASGEYLAHLDDVLSRGTSPDKAIFEKHHSIDAATVSSFREDIPNIINLLEPRRSNWNLVKIRDAIRRDEQIPGFSRQSPTMERRQQIAKALDAWRRVKSDGPQLDPSHLTSLKTILEYVGFMLVEPGAISKKTITGNLQNFQSWRIHARPVGSSPIAQFGSLRANYYDIIGVWDKPGVDMIGSQVNIVLQQTGNQPTILFYFHYLSQSKRDYLINSVRKSGIPMLVIDEALMLFLAKERDPNIEPMFRCTLPYSVVNPYFPAAAGKVPPEVYKGRTDLKRRLIDPFGTTIVYGGRQLGKSALLRQVEREYHHPENGQYVIYEDIRNIGDPASGKPYQVEFRDRFSQALHNLKLIDAQQRILDIDRLLNLIQQKVLVDGKKLLLLLDEADHFLSADADKNFQVIHKLKNLMDQTNRNFKIVIAGLHNVQRFEKISNQPLAHLGTPVEIGPLEPSYARDLIVDPLHAMGFYFGEDPEHEDNSIILHILSYTNYHPGLIQLFGSYLYDHLIMKHQQSTKPPFSITRDDVEAVYRKKEVRKEISDRFNWTLALDPLYEAVTLSLILEQLDEKNGFNKVFSPRELKLLAAENWPEAFGEKLSPERFAAMLEEMRGLGLLSVSTDNEYYRLRSPNIVSMMGTQDQILDRIVTLSSMPPPDENALTSFHFRNSSGVFSQITFGQERALNNPKSGVTLIHGTNAHGIRSLDQALARLVPKTSGVFREIHIASYGYESIKQQLDSLLKENNTANFFIAYRALQTSKEKMVDEIDGVIQFCPKIKNRNTFKVVFGLDSESTWRWFQIPQHKRDEISENIDMTMSLALWDRMGIRQWLDMESSSNNQIIATDNLVTEILDCTGGWPDLIEEFITRVKEVIPSKAIESIREDLSEKNSSLRNQFIASLGINEDIPGELIRLLQKSDIQEFLKEEIGYLDVLKLYNDQLDGLELEKGIEYLKKLSIVKTEPFLVLNSAVARAWDGS